MAQRRAYIIGGGGHARVVASLLDRDLEFHFVVPKVSGPQETAEDHFFSNIEDLKRFPIYLGIGNNLARGTVFQRLKAVGVEPAVCIASNAFIARNVEIGSGAVICPGVVVNAGARIGTATIINTLSGVDHDCSVGDFTQIAPGVSIGGAVTIGINGFIGIKSAIFQNVTVGDDVIVMAGSLVIHPIPDAVQVGGIPARIIKANGRPHV